jgi:serine/threonine protein kinase
VHNLGYKAHKLGIIHRDIKPENIIITPDLQTAYLVDFGIALSTEEAKRLTGTGYVIGTRVTFYEVLASQRMAVGVLLAKEDYREIVNPAIQWAFEMTFDDKVGRESIRKSLEEAAFVARDGAYEVLTEEILAYLKDVDLKAKEDWYLHTVRDVLEALMANPECNSGSAPNLGAIFRNINRVQR